MPAQGANSNKGGVQGLLDLLKEAGATGTATAIAACVKIAGRTGAPFSRWWCLCALPPPGTDREDCRRFGSVKRFCHNLKCANYGIVQLVRPNGMPVACAHGNRRPLHVPLAHRVGAVSCDPARSSCIVAARALAARHMCKYLGKGCSKPLLRQAPSSQWQRLVENESCEQLHEDGLMSAGDALMKCSTAHRDREVFVRALKLMSRITHSSSMAQTSAAASSRSIQHLRERHQVDCRYVVRAHVSTAWPVPTRHWLCCVFLVVALPYEGDVTRPGANER